MKTHFSCIFILSLIFAILNPAQINAQSKLYFEFGSGAVANIPSKLLIKQDNEEDIQINAKYESKPFEAPVYYLVRLGFNLYNMDWQLQFIHHKLYLLDPPKDVQHFEITHGFNIFTLNRSIAFKRMYLIGGIGLVLPHAQSKVRNKKYSSNNGILGTEYPVTGPALVVGGGKRFKLGDKFYVLLEGQFSSAWATVRVAEGEAYVSNYALHGLLSFGYNFKK